MFTVSSGANGDQMEMCAESDRGIKCWEGWLEPQLDVGIIHTVSAV